MNFKILAFAALCAMTGFAGAEGRVADCADCGTVRVVDEMSKAGESTGKGAILGAVIGGVVGHQIGGGKGNAVATVGGAAAGGYAGNQVEKNRSTGTYFRVTVDMDAGGMKEVEVSDPAGLTPGTRVRITGKDLERIS